MSQFLFKLPDVGEGVAEAELVAWHVAPGDLVREDQPLVDVMTDKATVELTSPVTGRVESIHGEPGVKLAIGSQLVVFEVDGAAAAPSPPPAGRAEPEAEPPPLPQPKPVPADPAAQAQVSKPLASPSVRKRAQDLGAPLQLISGSGPAGRISHADLDAYLAGGRGRAAAAAPVDRIKEIKVIGLRRRIAEKMAVSKRSIPHFSYIEEVDVTELEDLRTHLNATMGGGGRLTLLPFFVKAMVAALADFPQLNATFDDQAGVVSRHSAIHLGVATQTPGGLMVPVVHHAEAMGLRDLAQEIARVADAARSGSAQAAELTGSTITVTSLGPLGGVAHTPVINHPEVSIIGPNRVVERPVVRDGAIAVRKMMNVSSSFDHRVVDGYDAASFIQRLKGLLEHPGAIFAA